MRPKSPCCVNIFWFFAGLIFGTAVLLPPHAARADGNDLMFLPPAAVGKSIRIDGKGFVINGRRTFVASGSLHYARVPRGLWADRLERMKRAGFNTVSTYVFWAYQEPEQGKILFSGRRNLSAFLTLVHKMNMNAILRIGPYNNGEWSNGGLPNWLRFIPNMSVRTFTPPFIHALTTYFDKLLPIVAANQITHGGPVIMVQMENEYGPGWGAVLNNRYLRWMHGMAIKHGIDVPFFFSGLHQGFNPAGVHSFNSVGRPSPWFTTELWSGWFNAYGDSNPDFFFHWQFVHNPSPAVKVRTGAAVNAVFEKLHLEAVWRVLACGGSGYNIFMAVGGSNFSHWNCRSVRASYDFGAPIGQAGDLRIMYYHYKQANYFARAFSRILETSTDATAAYRTWLGKLPPGVHVYARKSPAGTIVFIMNTGNVVFHCQVPGGAPADIAPGHTYPVELNTRLSPWLKLRESCTRVFGIRKTARGCTLVVYGPAHGAGVIKLTVAGGAAILHKSSAFKQLKSPHNGAVRLLLPLRYPASRPRTYSIATAKGICRVICESRGMAMGTWFVNHPEREIVIGPWYVGQVKGRGRQQRMATESPLNLPAAWAYEFHRGHWLKFVPDRTAAVAVAPPAAPALGPWQLRLADNPAQPQYPDNYWLTSSRPRQIGFGDYPGDYQWYRAKLTTSRAGLYHLLMPRVSNYAAFFINGRQVAFGNPSVVPLDLKAGINTLAILAIAVDRSKLCSYVGHFRHIDYKGFYQPVRVVPVKLLNVPPVHQPAKGAPKNVKIAASAPLNRDAGVFNGVITDWRIRGGIGSPDVIAGWRPLSAGSPPPNVPCFYRSTFQWQPDVNGNHLVLRVAPGQLFGGYMWINGHNLGRYPDINMPLGLYLPSCWLKPGLNQLVILDDAGHSVSACKLVVETAASRKISELRPVKESVRAAAAFQ